MCKISSAFETDTIQDIWTREIPFNIVRCRIKRVLDTQKQKHEPYRGEILMTFVCTPF